MDLKAEKFLVMSVTSKSLIQSGLSGIVPLESEPNPVHAPEESWPPTLGGIRVLLGLMGLVTRARSWANCSGVMGGKTVGPGGDGAGVAGALPGKANRLVVGLLVPDTMIYIISKLQ